MNRSEKISFEKNLKPSSRKAFTPQRRDAEKTPDGHPLMEKVTFEPILGQKAEPLCQK